MSSLARIAALALLCCPLVPHTPAQAQEHHHANDAPVAQEERRLNIVGWTFVGVGVAFPAIAVPVSATRGNFGDDCDVIGCPDVAVALTSLVVGPVIAVTGGALLLRRRRLAKKRENQRSVVVVPVLRGVSISGRF